MTEEFKYNIGDLVAVITKRTINTEFQEVGIIISGVAPYFPPPFGLPTILVLSTNDPYGAWRIGSRQMIENPDSVIKIVSAEDVVVRLNRLIRELIEFKNSQSQ